MAEVAEKLENLKVDDKKEGKKKGKPAPGPKKDPAPFLQERLALFEKIQAEQKAKAVAENKPIKVTLPDGQVKEAVAGVTTSYDIAKGISQGLAERMIAAKVNGEVWDLMRPLEADCELKLLDFEDEDGHHVFWHSSAHLLGEVLEHLYDAHLCIGPPVEDGFYYDVSLPNGGVITASEFPEIEKEYKRIVKEKQKFERLPVTKEQALEMFKYNKYKVEIISEKIPDGAIVTVYRNGPLIDLCRGPHVPHTGKIKAFTVTKNSSSYWMGNAENDTLQRVYGIAFPDTAQLKQWKKFQEEAAKRDHRKIGKDQELFFFHPLSPGSCFFQPHGARIYNRLIKLMQDQYRQRGFEEVITPNMYDHDLWRTSGHLANYEENMFNFEVEHKMFGLKPMNCPGHCLIFGHRTRSYRELPMRLADFGVLHRNELSGALSGLTRVRRFQQDDAHIFCRPDQISGEIDNALQFMADIYGIFGFTFELKLSTRPEKYLGDIAVWDDAEKQLSAALDRFGHKWELNPGDGAFYGPKIDITLKDALHRSHQCATIQLDFQLPQRFELAYQQGDTAAEEDVIHRPVIIHRAILGSVERMIAVLTEHLAGKWPMWISPRQCIVLPVSDINHGEYAQQVCEQVRKAGYYCDTDMSNKKLQKKVREAQLAQYNYILVVGAEEVSGGTVNVRTRDNEVHGVRTVEKLLAEFDEMVKEFK
eukprot:TRINITY_DN1270_c0_g1_i1.p1 TRINITY_DN1270_c0_g1~~TRINITY_DN1270_c0_g1_i1.p1  ORF type:complete len:702 (-),score=262.11 TRINITY_DN1270_c0_g1_i1:226-2331(-)